MRLAIDLQGIQSEGSSTRGIGRYSLEIVKSIINQFDEHEFILVANGSLSDLRFVFESQLIKSNVTYLEWFSPCPLGHTSSNKLLIKLGILLRSYAFSSIDSDLILFTSFMEGFVDNCLLAFDCELVKAPIISIFYDVIPLINEDLYLNTNPDFAQFYKSKIKEFKKLDGLLAISESSRSEAIKYLDFNSKNVFNISSACNDSIFNEYTNTNLITSIDFEQIKPFLLYSGACDPRKNISRLLDAYSQLPSEFMNYKLVLVGKLLIPEIELIDSLIKQYKIPINKVIRLGYVSDDELAELYRKCSLFIFPSIHEGFGLPVLEAMKCGANVIASNSTSIPEIVELSDAMFDPKNVIDIKEKIIKGLTDNEFISDLKSNSAKQSRKFSWQKTASLAIKFCVYIASNKPINNDKFNWNYLSDLNSQNINYIINHIQNLLNKNKLEESTVSMIASSIDKISKQLYSYYRSVSSHESIDSWTVEGPFDSSYSLSILNRCFATALEKRINNVSINITEGYGDYEIDLNYLKQYTNIYDCYIRSKKSDNIPCIVSRNLYPPSVNNSDSKFHIFHSYGWEESEFPFDWVDNFNSYLQGVSVMSKIVRKILIDNGVNLPLQVSSLGLDHINSINADPHFTINAKNYKILHISSCFPRKGIDILLQAFGEAFNIDDDVTLIIKTFDNPHNNVEKILLDCRKRNSSYPDVLILKDNLNECEIKSLYLGCDLLVAPSRGEGFGLPIGEAMMLGLPVIVTAWGGHLDFCNSENSWLINYKFVSSKSHFSLPSSYWAEPSVDHLSRLMKEVYNYPLKNIETKIKNAKETVKSLTWDKTASNNISFIKNKLSLAEKYKTSTIGLISTWNTRCGIASYSKNLIDQFPEDVFIFAPRTVDNTSCNNIFFCWDLPCTNPKLDTLFTSIITNNITTMIIQFNYGLYDFNELSNLIYKLCSNNINIITILHSTIDPVGEPLRTLKDLVKPFKLCKRLIVHSINDLNRLKDLGLVDNVSIIPHGILDFRPKRKPFNPIKKLSISKPRITIASYGFCLPNKGYFQLVKAIAILRKRGMNIYLYIYSAIYNDDYYWVYDDLMNLIHNLGLEKYVSINKNYLESSQVLSNLEKHDLIIFPYQQSNESSSAAARDGLATGKPVFVSPLPIFDDISSFVNYLSGISSRDIAHSIISWLEKDKVNRYKDSKDNLSRLSSLRFSRIGYRFYLMLKSLELNKD